MRTRLVQIAAAVLLTLGAAIAAADELRVADLGDLRLDSGEVIRHCRIGYRSFGALNAERSNVIVLTTWFIGTSRDFGTWVGAGRLYDSSKYYIIIIDALGDGVSSSPSTSAEQHGAAFPQFTIRDMVRAQHELLTRELHLDHVFAVSGLSMGGMQTFQWVVSYPDYMTKAVPIVGTPRQTSNDLLLWQTELSLLESRGACPEAMKVALKGIAGLQALHLRTPSWVAGHLTRDKLAGFVADEERAIGSRDPWDYAAQLRAMVDHDIYRDFGGSPEAAARAVHARMLVVVALQDHMVNPAPARELARLTGSDVVTLSGDCGHLASGCERDMLISEASRFLDAK
jgi:homoserine O-acetyltransferase